MSQLRSAIANLLCCCSRCNRTNNDYNLATVTGKVHESSSVTAAALSHRTTVQSMATAPAAAAPPTPEVRAPYQRRSSLSLYEQRAVMLKRYCASTSSVEKTGCPSLTYCSVTETTVLQHVRGNDIDDVSDDDDDDDDDDDGEVDVTVEECDVDLSSLFQPR